MSSWNLIRSLLVNESGATAVEYGMIAILISVATFGTLQALGTSFNTIFLAISNTTADASFATDSAVVGGSCPQEVC